MQHVFTAIKAPRKRILDVSQLRDRIPTDD